MKRLLATTLLLCLFLTGCGQSIPTGSTKLNITKSTAEEIVSLLKERVSTIENIIVYNEETDPNNSLGRPNQYTSKVNFADSRVEQFGDSPTGGTVEVFNNETDCKTRADYISSLQQNMPLLGSQYIYQYKNILLRIDQELTPTQAREYEAAFIELQ